jgi:hypothetical protein
VISRLAFALAVLTVYVGLFGLPSAYAQQSAPPRHIGVLLVARSAESEEAQAFRRALVGAGYSEGRDVVIEWRAADAIMGRCRS